MKAFAIYRLPHASQCTLVGQDGMPVSLSSLSDLTGKESGFLISPFSMADGRAIVLLQPDEVRKLAPDKVAEMDDLPFHSADGKMTVSPCSRETYHDDFSRFHRAFSATGIQKLVLARSEDFDRKGCHPAELFARACQCYPEAFVTLFSAPQCGTWLVASPEVLLLRDSVQWHTMALAGTMRYADHLPQWSDKNVREQDYVTRYIKACLDRYSDDVSLTGPYTKRAGGLVHLCTDFSFNLSPDVRLGDVLDAMHPTPAVCGLPKEEALQFILDNESVDRDYYSGFSGPLNLEGQTSFFVSLRCMRIIGDRYRLFAGGGILPESDESLEWEETEAKMQTMLSLMG